MQGCRHLANPNESSCEVERIEYLNSMYTKGTFKTSVNLVDMDNYLTSFSIKSNLQKASFNHQVKIVEKIMST